MNVERCGVRRRDPGRGGFTLVELLVVIAVIAILVGVLVPALTGARAAAQDAVCRNNLRQIGQAFFSYAFDYQGQFPVNNVGAGVPPEESTSWYNDDVIGEYLIETYKGGEDFADDTPDTVGGSVYVCPSHPQGARSYTMNYWASSNVQDNSRGDAWNVDSVRAPTDTLLLADAWGFFKAGEPLGTVFVTASTMGAQGMPGERFGGGVGVNDYASGDALPSRRDGGAPEFSGKAPTSYLPYYRHPARRENTTAIEGGCHICFADGHVGKKLAQNLFDQNGISSLEVVWSDKDFELVNEAVGP